MIIVLNNPSMVEMEFVEKLLKENSSGNLKPFVGNDVQATLAKWLNPVQFETEMAKKGYRCSTSKTRKKLCEEYGIQYEKRGKELWFCNELHKIPSRIADN
jgi:hypothetical protein